MYPEELKYNVEHTWLKVEKGGLGRVGITYYAQEQLKEVVFVELPEIGTEVKQMEPFGVIESVKATNDLYSPVSGIVAGINEALKDEPALVNQDPYVKGWMIIVKMNNPSEINNLLPAKEYQGQLQG